MSVRSSAALIALALAGLIAASCSSQNTNSSSSSPPSSESPTRSAAPNRVGITNGHDADLATTKWFVQLRIVLKGADTASATCGGSAISPHWVLTAAHCAVDPAGNMIKTGEGASYVLVNPVQFNTGTPVYIDRIVIHPSYLPGKTAAGSDIALLHTTTPLRTEDIRLNEDPEIPVSGQPIEVYGFGRTSPKGPRSEHLQVVQLDEVATPDHKCGAWETSRYNPVTQLCAADPAGTKSACKGDSGGPLVVDSDGRKEQVGIVSFGPGACATPDRPGITTRVSAFASWIQSVIAR